jgi:hypothetical protein
MSSSGKLRRVALVRTNVWEERIAFIISNTRIGELGRLAVTRKRSTLHVTRARRRNVPEDGILQEIILLEIYMASFNDLKAVLIHFSHYFLALKYRFIEGHVQCYPLFHFGNPLLVAVRKQR